MRTVMVGLLALVMAGSAMAQEAVGAGTSPESVQTKKKSKKPLYIATAESFATCGIAIGLSSNPAGAAMVGLPILTGGTIAAYKLYPKHSKFAVILQSVSGLGCMARIDNAHRTAAGRKFPKPPTTPKPTTGSGSGGGSTGGNGGSTGSGGSGSTGGTGTGGSGSGSTGGSGSGGSGGSGSGGSSGGSGSGSGGGTGGSGGGGNPPPSKGCIKDCGFPGNGGVNGGNDNKKPPFPGKGNGGSNIGNGNKNN